MSNFLSDTWEVNGTNFDNFKEELEKIEKNTKIKEIPMDNFYFLSVSDVGTGYVAVPLHSDEFWKKSKVSLSLKKFETEKEKMFHVGFEDDVINEAFENGLFVAYSDKKVSSTKVRNMVENFKYFPVSEKAMNTISNRISHSGYGFFTDRLVRDLAISKRFNKPIPVSVISRIDDTSNLEKIFAIMSNKYTKISQKVIIDIIDEIRNEAKADLGKMECDYWMINHSVTRIYLEFPEAGKEISETYKLPDEMIPGIMLETSDIGDCSLRMRGYFKVCGTSTISYMENEFSKIHSGAFDIKAIVKAVTNDVFPKYTLYPEHLAHLMEIDITDESMSANRKIKTMTTLYRKVSREIGLVKAIGKNREKSLMDQLIESINPLIDYTAYDVAMTFLTLSEYIETDNKNIKEAIAKVGPEIMEYDFDPDTEELLVV